MPNHHDKDCLNDDGEDVHHYNPGRLQSVHLGDPLDDSTE